MREVKKRRERHWQDGIMVLYTLVSGLSAGLVDRNVARMLSRMNKFKNTCWGKKKDIKKKPYDSWSGSTN
jgi:hypothetical protein